MWGGSAEVQHAAASWASLDKLGGKPREEAKNSVTVLPGTFAYGFSLLFSYPLSITGQS